MGVGLTPAPVEVQRCTETPTWPGSITRSLAHDTPPTINSNNATTTAAPTARLMTAPPCSTSDLQPTFLAPPGVVIEHVDGRVDGAITLDAAAVGFLTERFGVAAAALLVVAMLRAAIDAQPEPASGADDQGADAEQQDQIDDRHARGEHTPATARALADAAVARATAS